MWYIYNEDTKIKSREKSWLFFDGEKQMLKTCKYCGRIVEPKHRCIQKPKYDKKDKEITAFRNSREWKEKRKEIQQRDKNLCRYCLSKNRLVYDQIDIHHIVPLKINFEMRLDNDNLISLCRMCHEEAEAGKITKDELQKIILTPPQV